MKNNSAVFKVFSYTFSQYYKVKATKIITIVFCLLALISMPVVSFFADSSDDASDTIDIDKLYVYNTTNLNNIDFSSEIANDSHMKNIKLENIANDSEYDDKKKDIDENDKKSIILKISITDNTYTLDFCQSSSKKIKQKDITYLSDMVKNFFDVKRLGNDNNVKVLNDISSETKINSRIKTDKIGKEQNDPIVGIYFSMFIMIMVTGICSSVGNSIATDKTSRVNEYIITSIKPMDSLLGKVLANVASVICMFGSMIACLFISNCISKKFFSYSFSLKKLINVDMTPISIIVAILLIIIGLIFYSIIASLCAATVSTIEELAVSLKPVTTLNMITYLIAAILLAIVISDGGEMGIVYKLFSGIPFLSPYVVPVLVIFNKVNIVYAICVFVILGLSCYLLLKLSTNVFTSAIMYNGNKKKLSYFFKKDRKEENHVKE